MANTVKNFVYWVLLAVLVYGVHVYSFNKGCFKCSEQSKIEQQEVFVNFVTENITYCESRNVHNRTGKAKEFGVAQFKEKTFNWMKGLAGKPGLDWRSESDQRILLHWAIKNGYGNHWKTCYGRASKRFAAAKLPEIIASAGVPKSLIKFVSL